MPLVLCLTLLLLVHCGCNTEVVHNTTATPPDSGVTDGVQAHMALRADILGECNVCRGGCRCLSLHGRGGREGPCHCG